MVEESWTPSSAAAAKCTAMVRVPGPFRSSVGCTHAACADSAVSEADYYMIIMEQFLSVFFLKFYS